MERLRRLRSVLARVACSYCVVVLSAFAPLSWAGVNEWTSTGPDGGYVHGVAWHPTRDGVLFATAGRIYRSTNSGATWSAASAGSPVSGQFIFDPNNADRILASGQPTLRSVDGGSTFTPAVQLPNFQGAQHLVITADGSTVYAAGGGKVFRSNDFAETWVEVSAGLPGGVGDFPITLRISPASSTTLYVAFGSTGVFRTTNGGSSWSPVTTMPGIATGLAINPNNASQMLVSTSSPAALWRSLDAGATWSTVAFGFFRWFDFDPLVVNRVIAADNFSKRLYVSTDGGGAWLQAAPIPAVQVERGSFSHTTAGAFAFGTTEGVYYSSDGGQTLAFRSTGIRGADLRAIAVSRSAPFRVFATFYGGPTGVHLRAPGAWQPVGSSQLFAALTSTTVLDGVAVDPDNSSIVYAAGFGGVARSTDTGSSWTSLSPVFSTNPPYMVAIDPTNTQVLYVASTTAGVLRSTDGGATWTPRNNGLPVVGMSVPIFHVTIDPADSQRMYAFQQSPNFLYRTTDGGLNWTKVASGVPPTEVFYTVSFDPLNPNRVYLGGQDGLYLSLDGGGTWSAMTLPVGSRAISSVLIDPVTPGTMVLVLRSGAPGIIRTVDYGASWERLPWVAQSDFTPPPSTGVLDPVQAGNLIVGGVQLGMQEFQIAPDLAVSTSGLSSRVSPGSTHTLRVTVQHKVSSLYAASDATASVTLPAVMIPGSLVTTRGTCVSSGLNITCRLGALKVGDIAHIDVPVTVAAGTGAVMASVLAREIDLLPADNSTALPVSGEPIADLRAEITAPATAIRGTSALLQGRVTNAGPDPATNARLTFTLPPGLTVSNAGPCTLTGSTVTCQAGTLAASGSATFELQTSAVTPGVQNASLSASAVNHDANLTNNTASAAITVRPVSDLALTWSTPPPSIVAGQSGSATATVTNNGPDPVNVAVVTVSGTSLGVTAATASGGTCAIASATANCSLGTLAAGASRTVEVSFSATAAGTAQLTSVVSSEASDGTAGNNEAVRSVSVTAAPASGGGGGGGSGGGGALGAWGILAMAVWLARCVTPSAVRCRTLHRRVHCDRCRSRRGSVGPARGRADRPSW